MRHARVLLLAVALATLAAPAFADDRQTTTGHEEPPAASSASPAQSMKALLNDNFEIKAVSVIPKDIVKRGGSTLDVDAVMIILERGPDVANCYVTFGSFADGSYYNGDTPICTVLK
jgi:hypothetical protein